MSTAIQRRSLHRITPYPSDDGLPIAAFEREMSDESRTCPLCKALVGMRVRIDRPEFYWFSPPLHKHCTHEWEFIYGGPGHVEDFKYPPMKLVVAHGDNLLKRLSWPEMAQRAYSRFIMPLSRVALDPWAKPDIRRRAWATQGDICHALGLDAMADWYYERSLSSRTMTQANLDEWKRVHQAELREAREKDKGHRRYGERLHLLSERHG